MYKAYSTPKVVRTWVLLFSVPLYIGTASLWLKEEIKGVLAGKEAMLLKNEENKSFGNQKAADNAALLPNKIYTNASYSPGRY